jgi:phenylacetate-CoA ligase
MVTGAEKLRDDQREVVRRVFGRPVHERYGSRDVGIMAFQSNAPRDTVYEVDWANVLLEPETTEPESSILVTKLHADAMPMIRYRVGDLARFDERARPGSPAFSLIEIVGREADRIWLKDGRWVHGLSYPHMMKDFPVREYQVFQGADYGVVIRVVPSGPFPDGAREELVRLIAANLPGLDPRLELVEEIPRTASNKLRPVISEVARPARAPAVTTS